MKTVHVKFRDGAELLFECAEFTAEHDESGVLLLHCDTVFKGMFMPDAVAAIWSEEQAH